MGRRRVGCGRAPVGASLQACRLPLCLLFGGGSIHQAVCVQTQACTLDHVLEVCVGGGGGGGGGVGGGGGGGGGGLRGCRVGMPSGGVRRPPHALRPSVAHPTRSAL